MPRYVLALSAVIVLVGIAVTLTPAVRRDERRRRSAAAVMAVVTLLFAGVALAAAVLGLR